LLPRGNFPLNYLPGAVSGLGENTGEIMTAYVIMNIEVIDPSGYEEYKKLVPPVIKLFGGKYLVRGGRNETLEGDWHAQRLVILEFKSMEKAKTWLNSPEYASARALRHKYAKTKMIVVDSL